MTDAIHKPNLCAITSLPSISQSEQVVHLTLTVSISQFHFYNYRLLESSYKPASNSLPHEQTQHLLSRSPS